MGGSRSGAPLHLRGRRRFPAGTTRSNKQKGERPDSRIMNFPSTGAPYTLLLAPISTHLKLFHFLSVTLFLSLSPCLSKNTTLGRTDAIYNLT